MNGDTLAKILLVLITLCFATFASAAEKVPFGSEPLAPEEAFVMDHIIVGPSEAVIRWQIPKFYYLYKEKFIFTSKDFIIENVQFPPPVVIELFLNSSVLVPVTDLPIFSGDFISLKLVYYNPDYMHSSQPLPEPEAIPSIFDIY